MLFQGFQVFFNGVVDTQVNHLKARTFHHHSDKVFTDVMDVAFDRSDDHLANGLYAGFSQERTQNLHAALHCVGSEQHFRNKQNTIAEINTHDAHAFDQSVIENPGS